MEEKMKLIPLQFPSIPERYLGRVRNDGNPDRRYTNGLLMAEERLKSVTGISPYAKGGSNEM